MPPVRWLLMVGKLTSEFDTYTIFLVVDYLSALETLLLPFVTEQCGRDSAAGNSYIQLLAEKIGFKQSNVLFLSKILQVVTKIASLSNLSQESCDLIVDG